MRRDLAWHCTETNEMGIDDFYLWSQKAGTEIMLAVNMGTRGLKAALDELEYVNGAPAPLGRISAWPTASRSRWISRCGASATKWTAVAGGPHEPRKNMPARWIRWPTP